MAITCEKVEQIVVFLENRPGILADLCAHLADRDINIRAITSVEATEAGVIRLILDRPEAAKEVLSEARVSYTTSQCLVVEMPNYPGGFAHIARELALAGINIDYIYATTIPSAGSALGVLGVSDLERALQVDWGK
jgi:hypothetical protein